MKSYSRRGLRARMVPLRRRSQQAGRQILAAVGRVAREAQVQSAHASAGIQSLISRCAVAAAPKFALHPALENLENRTMLSSATLTDGVLTLTGDAGSDNSLTVDIYNGQYSATADGCRRAQSPDSRCLDFSHTSKTC